VIRLKTGKSSAIVATALEMPLLIAKVSRRSFLQGASTLGGLMLAVGYASALRAEDSPKYGADAMPHGWVDNPLVFVAIGVDGTVSIVCHRSEMGQGVRTSLAMIIADELEADWSRVRVVQAPGDEARYGNQDTDGSRSLRHFFMPMRRCGAAARQMFEAAAAARWQVPVDEVHAQLGEIVHAASGRRVGYGALARAAARQPLPAAAALRLKEPAEFRYIGTGKVKLFDAPAIVNGTARYALDMRFTGLLHAVIARPQVYGGTVVSYDARAALKIPGVVAVVQIEPSPAPPQANPLGGIAVLANNTWAAIKGRKALKIVWRDGANASYDSAAYKGTLEAAARKPGKVVRNDGDLDAAMASAAKRITAEYYLPHLAHASMEPPTATARFVQGKCEVWGGFQSPQGVRDQVAKRLGIPAEQVTVQVTLLGGGFGRKSMGDFGVEAAVLSKAMGGQPVQVVWTREDDLHNDYFHTVSVEHLEAGVNSQGLPVAWLHRTVAPTIDSSFDAAATQQANYELGMGAINVPFAIPSVRIENPPVAAHTRIGWFRSVSNIPHAFAVQSFVAELAAAAQRDPKDFLLDVIGSARLIASQQLNDTYNEGESPERYPVDTGRLRGVVERAAKEAGWGRSLPKGGGLGIAAHYSFVSYVAAVIEVEIDAKGQLTIPRVDIAIDCGAAVNPDRIRSQLEGACIMGVSAALSGAITFKNGRAQQDNFHQFEVTRMSAAPREIRVHILPGDFKRPLGGVGEPGLPPVLPALCNAIFAATGKRIRELPIGNQLSRTA
jgi:isoquinoline 1-oxidoreductase subunit beta